MVCLQDERSFDVLVRNQCDETEKKEILINLTYQQKIDNIFNEIATKFQYNVEEIEILYHTSLKTITLSEYKGKDWLHVGVNSSPTDYIEVQMKRDNNAFIIHNNSEDELLLGASASPTTTTRTTQPDNSNEFYNYQSPDMPVQQSNDFCTDLESIRYRINDENNRSNRRKAIACVKDSKYSRTSTNYVGLVNQAMTCYLNSLLQALYMTPEFRNALYNWEFDGQNETRSIPYQLQKLFLNLQTSSKSAVETTDLTTSFGWQGSDAWQQHDIQELCRVMFDALEQKFKDTKQANLINDLYEGKMLDYVKCLECSTEKSREDTFLDIPLPVRPFGSAVAYNSVEEALRAFVQPETLDGNNQYFCETCNKKCDAHKGLKFTKFPYLLTLHLKRFDFDYNTMHRIKLNDKVVFSEKLNLNSFISNSNKNETDTMEERDTVKCDDCSTTDSGSADDESCQGTDASSTVNGQDDNCADSDEGIDVSSGNNPTEKEIKGPYIYELFSIMIHSGSASGGHYYAYIKDFDKNSWFCFNDQSVSGITEEDIRKTYGGGPQKGYYSGAYSTSTNAYMLMYRQIDKNRNCRTMTAEEFPPHIQKLLDEMHRKEEEDRKNREKENDMVKLNVYYINPLTNLLQDIKIGVFTDSTVAEAAQYVHQRLKLTDIVPIEDCRLVIYNRKQDCIDCSLESDDLIKFCDIFDKTKFKQRARVALTFFDWMLEIRKPGEEWQEYKRGGINMKVYPINLETEEIDQPFTIRVDVTDTVLDLKMKLLSLLNIDLNCLGVVLSTNCLETTLLLNDNELIKFDPNIIDYKLFVYNNACCEDDIEKRNKKLQRVIEKFCFIISLNVVLPDTDVGTLETLSIPSLDLNQNNDKLETDISSPNLRISPQPSGLTGDGFGDQSNSEDSSLSESDRTLVGDHPDECIGLLSSNSNSPADQHMSFPTDPVQESYNFEINFEEMGCWGDVEVQHNEAKQNCYYFKVTSVVHCNSNNKSSMYDGDSQHSVRCCKILVDKRMNLEHLKKHLEMFVRVPMEYFKIFKQYGNTDDEWSCLTDTLRSSVKDGERLLIKLGRVLRKGEVNSKVYHLKPDFNECYLFEHIIAKGQTVNCVKKEILLQAKKQYMLDIPYNKCRLREKCWKKPRKVYLDDQKFSDNIVMASSFEMFLQELNDVEMVTSYSQLVLFIRHWSPSTLTLHPIREIVLETLEVDELKKKISQISDIPYDNIELAHIKCSFPFDVHLLDVQELDWTTVSGVDQLDKWPLNTDDGSMFFYRDKTESLKELTPEEKKEINQRENARLGKSNSKSYYSFSSFPPFSPGRERALKIYLDSSPSKSEDNYLD